MRLELWQLLPEVGNQRGDPVNALESHYSPGYHMTKETRPVIPLMHNQTAFGRLQYIA